MPRYRKNNSSGPPLGGMLCGDGLLWWMDTDQGTTKIEKGGTIGGRRTWLCRSSDEDILVHRIIKSLGRLVVVFLVLVLILIVTYLQESPLPPLFR